MAYLKTRTIHLGVFARTEQIHSWWHCDGSSESARQYKCRDNRSNFVGVFRNLEKYWQLMDEDRIVIQTSTNILRGHLKPLYTNNHGGECATFIRSARSVLPAVANQERPIRMLCVSFCLRLTVSWAIGSCSLLTQATLGVCHVNQIINSFRDLRQMVRPKRGLGVSYFTAGNQNISSLEWFQSKR